MAHSVLPKPGATFGDWTIIDALGSGGNGAVWRVTDSAGTEGAIKFLLRRHRTNEKRYSRFRHEAEAMRACGDIEGVLPLLEAHVPDRPTNSDPPWLVSALAQPLEPAFDRANGLSSAVRLCAELGETLAEMHKRGYAHRDIKPANIFLHRSRWCVGDFGLADFPDKTHVTGPDERLGPMHYIAPEMLNDADGADGRPADVYSLAKLLWKLATGQTYPLPGVQFAYEPALTISAYVADERAKSLDRLLEVATQVKPGARPTMEKFASGLQAWLTPPSLPEEITDLTQFSEIVSGMLAPEKYEQARLDALSERSSTELNRLVKLLNTALDDIGSAFKTAGFEEIELDTESKFSWPGPSAERDFRWVGFRSVAAHIDKELLRATLECSFLVRIEIMNGVPIELFDPNAPLTVEATSSVKEMEYDADYNPIQPWQTNSQQTIWHDERQFIAGHPEEAQALTALTAGMKATLPEAIRCVIRTFEAAVEKDRLEREALRKSAE